MADHAPKTCIVCGKEFIPLSSRQKCCRGACGREWHHRLEVAYCEKRKTGYRQKACAICGAIFVPTGHCARYCPECRAVAYEEERKRYRKLHKEHKAEYDRLYIQQNHERLRAQEKKWVMNNPLRVKAARKKKAAKRRSLGFVPLNQPFAGCEGHHIDKQHVVYIPKELHHSIFHNVWTGKNMDAINAVARSFAGGVF